MKAAPAHRTGSILVALCGAILAGAAPTAAHAGDLGTALSADQGRAVAEELVSACAADKACSATASAADDTPEQADPSRLDGDGTGHVVWDDGRTRVRVGGHTRVDFSVVR